MLIFRISHSLQRRLSRVFSFRTYVWDWGYFSGNWFEWCVYYQL